MSDAREKADFAPRITVLGGGAWGTALAAMLAAKRQGSSQNQEEAGRGFSPDRDTYKEAGRGFSPDRDENQEAGSARARGATGNAHNQEAGRGAHRMRESGIRQENTMRASDIRQENPMRESGIRQENAMRASDIRQENTMRESDIRQENPMRESGIRQENAMRESDIRQANAMRVSDIRQAEGARDKVALYCRRAEQAAAINAARQNSAYLPNIVLPPALWATADAAAALLRAEIVLAVFPAQALREALRSVQAFMPPRAALVLCSKGIERGSGKFAAAIARDIFPENPLAVLSGPSFAADVARGLPTAVTLAAETESLARALAADLSSPSFRCYACADIIGAELGGALKNVLALAAGMAAGRGLGASAQAALISRGFAELRRAAAAFGGKAETMAGLAVLGDLVLSCSSAQSRNFAYGYAFGQGKDTANMPLAEGVATAPAAAALCAERGLDTPLIYMVADILAKKLSLDEAVRRLLTRPLKFED